MEKYISTKTQKHNSLINLLTITGYRANLQVRQPSGKQQFKDRQNKQEPDKKRIAELDRTPNQAHFP